MDSVFSIEESLKFGWEKLKANSMLIFQVLLTLFGVQVVHAIVDRVLHDTVIGGLALLAISVVGVILGTGFINITLKLARGESAVYRDIVPPFELVWRVFLVSLLTAIIVFVGLILLIIPGVYLALRFSMVRFIALEGASVTESLNKSTAMTKDIKWELLFFFVICLVLNILGAILLMVGLLVTVPVTMIAYAHIYEKIKHRAHVHEHHEHVHEGHEHHHEHHHEENAAE